MGRSTYAVRFWGQVLRKYLRGTQGCPGLCFGGFSIYREPNCPLSSLQLSGAIEETGPILLNLLWQVCHIVWVWSAMMRAFAIVLGLTFVKRTPWSLCVVIQLQGVRHGRSILAPCVLRPLLLVIMHLSIGDKVFYTRSTGLRVTAKVVAHLDDGHVELGYYQDGVQVVNHRCHIHPISFSIPNLDPPPPTIPVKGPQAPVEAALKHRQ